jgi:hypothetical protein
MYGYKDGELLFAFKNANIREMLEMDGKYLYCLCQASTQFLQYHIPYENKKGERCFKITTTKTKIKGAIYMISI